MSTPKFLFDVHLAKEAVRQLQLKGIDVLHVGEIGLADAPDTQIMAYAVEDRRVMVSCDEGYARFHYDFVAREVDHFGIVYFRMEDQCQSISVVVREIQLIASIASTAEKLINQLWRATT